MSELRVEGPRGDHDLVFYSLSTCVMCRKAREYLGEKGFAYRIVNVDQLDPAEKERLKQELGRRHGMRVVFPALVIDGRRLVLGFFRAAWEQALEDGSGRG